jgi:hypothetical protein
MLDRAHAKVDIRDAPRALLEPGLFDAGTIGVDGMNPRRVRGVGERQPSIAAADLEDAFVSKAHKALDEPTLEAVGRICRELRGDHRGIVAQSLSERGRGGSAGRPSRKQATAQEGTLQRPVSVHPSPTEAGDLARGVEAR